MSYQNQLDLALSEVRTNLLEVSNACQTPLLKDALNYVSQIPGKMLRPKLTLIAGTISDVNPGMDLIRAATALELLHIASLIHDDILDESTERRTLPTVHVKFGTPVAILLGDWMLAHSFELMSQSSDMARQEFADLTKRLCEGQFLEAELKSRDNYQIKDYFQMVSLKTGCMFESSLMIGLTHHRTDWNPLVLKSLRQFGTTFGIAFQIADDILDLCSSKEFTGKDTQNDIRQGLRTLPVLLALKNDQDSPLLHHLKQDNQSWLEKNLTAYLVSGTYMDQARDMAEDYINKADEELRKLPQGPWIEDLSQLGQGLKKRLSQLFVS